VQPDAGLVEHIEHPDEAGPDLGGEPDPLGLTTRERACGAGQAQVVETDVEQESEALVDLLDDAFGDLELALGQGDVAQEIGGLPDRES